jgi:hypothetical protein
MKLNPDNPKTWHSFKPPIIAHDVGCTRDRSTAVMGGISPFHPNVLGITELYELPQGRYGNARAQALAEIDRRFGSRALIIVDVSNERTYAEVMFEFFGQRVIGLHITRSGDGMSYEWWPVKNGRMLVYTIGRTYLFDILHAAFNADQVRIVDEPASRLAYEQLAELEIELRESGRVYKCLPGQHDDLGISCAMLAFAARHAHLPRWMRFLEPPQAFRKLRPAPSALGWT